MSTPPMIDAQRLSLMLNELRLPAIKHMWGDFAARADKEGWVMQLLERKKPKVAAVALANKNARIIWAMMATGEPYQEPELAAA